MSVDGSCPVCSDSGLLLDETCPLCDAVGIVEVPCTGLAGRGSNSSGLLGIGQRLARGDFSNIIVCTGAGVSVNCGIPDFRSPGGFFEHIRQELGSRFPEVNEHPEVALSRYFANNHPQEHERILSSQTGAFAMATLTDCHFLLALLAKKGILRRVYTQNVDGLHQRAGIPQGKVVEAHGSFERGDPVLYGDPMPQAFEKALADDFPSKDLSQDQCDLMLVLGSSLQVAPFCGVPNLPGRNVPRVLVTKSAHQCFRNEFSHKSPSPYSGCCSQDSTVQLGGRKVTLRPQWHDNSKYRDQHVFDEDVDDWARRLADAAGWAHELDNMRANLNPQDEDA